MATPPHTTAPHPTTSVPAPRAAPVTHHPVPRVDDDRSPPAGDDLSAVAWIVREVTHVPGVLRLRAGRLSFESTRGVLFDGSAADLALEVGRSARAGLRVTVGGERLRVHVVRPPGGVAPCAELVDRLTGDAPSTRGDAASWAPWRAWLAPSENTTAPPARSTRVRRAMSVFAPIC